MSLTRDHNDIVFQCDGCRDTLETSTSNFESARNLLKRARWKAIRNTDPRGDEWLHSCVACQRKAELPLNTARAS